MRFVSVLVLALASVAPAQQATSKPAPPPVAQPGKPVKPEGSAETVQQLEQTVAELRAKLRELEGQLARRERKQKEREKHVVELFAQPPKLAPVAIKAPPAAGGVVLDVRVQPPAFRAPVVRKLVRGAGGRLVLTTEEEASPLVRGDYESALEQLDEARREMSSAEEIPDALRALDRASKALMEARTALWKQRDQKDKPQKKATPSKNEKSK